MLAPLKKNDIVDITIDSLGSEMQGVGRHEDLVIFVPFALPGEKVRVHILNVKKNYAFAKLVEVLLPSAYRVTPPCPYYGRCGGCSCQHMDYTASLDQKQAEVANNLKKIAGVDVIVNETLGMNEPWYYRNKMAVPVQQQGEEIISGFYAPRSHRIVPLEQCIISMPPSDNIVASVRMWMKDNGISPYNEETGHGTVRHIVTRVNRKGESIVLLVINDKRLPKQDKLIALLKEAVIGLKGISISVNQSRGNTILGQNYQVVWGEAFLYESILGVSFRISPLSFFQVNPVMTEFLYNKALALCDPKPHETMLDIYCGAGTIALCFSPHVAKAVGIEIVAQAMQDAQENARLNDVQNVSFIEGKAEVELPKLMKQGFQPDFAVVDPPRKGVEKEVLDSLIQAQISRVLYISCHPATQARDARYLLENGYEITDCSPVDMFCQTSGIENILLFKRP